MADPVSPTEGDDSGRSRLVDLVAILSITYTDIGIATWLDASNRYMNSATPLHFILAGDIERVVEVAERIDGIPATEAVDHLIASRLKITLPADRKANPDA